MRVQIPRIDVSEFIFVIEELQKHCFPQLKKTSINFYVDDDELSGDCLKFWKDRQSILSYIISVAGFGWEQVDGPKELLRVCQSLNDTFISVFPKKAGYTFFEIVSVPDQKPRAA